MKGEAVTFPTLIFNPRQEKRKMESDDLINGLRHMASDHECCRETIEYTIRELEHLERKANCAQFDLDAWESWCREVCADFKIEYDNHPIGLRLAVVKWMAEKNKTA
jgi:hypothetical protein